MMLGVAEKSCCNRCIPKNQPVPKLCIEVVGQKAKDPLVRFKV